MRDEVIRRGRGAVAALVLAGLVVAPWVVDDYTTAILARTLALALVGVSVALLTGVAGMPTLGQTAPYAAGAYACVVVGGRISDVGVVQLAVAAGAGAVLAALTVPLVVHARGVIVLMITLAIGELVVTILGRWRSVTGGTDGLAGLPAVRPFWGLPPLASDQARYLYTLVVVATLVGAVLLLLRTRAGLLLRAGRDDETRLRASGHRVPLYVSGAHIAAGAIAGGAGSLLVVAQQYISPADFGFDTSALLLLGVVIGGTASIGGALVGAALVIAVRDWLFGVLPGHAPLVLGALFVATVYLLPTGVNRARVRLRPSSAAPSHPQPPPARDPATVPELRA
ncbi:branched-chain amino acid ABC transporter permease [Micromonospora arborensis]|uniref:branched-chain amino acid ABC transporter permease n=1 Tax=Micromonospora arborensis TaxID=2116518 RepID=UPI00340106F3